MAYYQPPPPKKINEPFYGDTLSEEIRRDSYNADNDLYEADSPYDYIVAGHGFHGYVDHPMNFIVGEKGRERVDIYKTEKKHKHSKHQHGKHHREHHQDVWDVSEYFGGGY